MGTFGIFSKEKKQSLDKGLEKTKESVFKKLSRAVVGKTKVDDEVLDNLEEVLILLFLVDPYVKLNNLGGALLFFLQYTF